MRPLVRRLCAWQLCNSLVFVYDGLLSAAKQFEFVRNVFIIGVGFLFAPALGILLATGNGLWRIWAAKAVLNTWRCATAIWRIDFFLPRQWASSDEEVRAQLSEGLLN